MVMSRLENENNFRVDFISREGYYLANLKINPAGGGNCYGRKRITHRENSEGNYFWDVGGSRCIGGRPYYPSVYKGMESKVRAKIF